jgi:hypothetical protein
MQQWWQQQRVDASGTFSARVLQHWWAAASAGVNIAIITGALPLGYTPGVLLLLLLLLPEEGASAAGGPILSALELAALLVAFAQKLPLYMTYP